MPTFRDFANLALFIVVLLGAAVVYVWQTKPMVPVNRVELGMSRDQVIAIVGKTPEWERQEYSWCESRPKSCEEVKNSGAVKFLEFKGINSVLVIGLDASDAVRFREAIMF
jgi:hypothetical protein